MINPLHPFFLLINEPPQWRSVREGVRLEMMSQGTSGLPDNNAFPHRSFASTLVPRDESSLGQKTALGEFDDWIHGI